MEQFETSISAAVDGALGLPAAKFMMAAEQVRVAFRLMVHADRALSLGRSAYLIDEATDVVMRGITPPGTLTEAEFATLARVAYRLARDKETRVAQDLMVGPEPATGPKKRRR